MELLGLLPRQPSRRRLARRVLPILRGHQRVVGPRGCGPRLVLRGRRRRRATAALDSQCAGDHPAAECSWCAKDSARVVPALVQRCQAPALRTPRERWWPATAYGCYLRVPLFAPPARWMD
ncbi:hypothetical protein C2845_PM02G36760 [Panicum miliaceum]|uniref:Uncharacterized protein n=1 Tax=Panicum miliaceum TaxID=4540 RepID=A0A3L6SDP2_PANMI|nr:hypothetical protein C2845_PM02G36760 [Panicum miliaceum]